MVTLWDGEQEIDRYTLRVGIREIKVTGNQLLLNGATSVFEGIRSSRRFPSYGPWAQPARGHKRLRAAALDRGQQLPHVSLPLFGGDDAAGG